MQLIDVGLNSKCHVTRSQNGEFTILTILSARQTVAPAVDAFCDLWENDFRVPCGVAISLVVHMLLYA